MAARTARREGDSNAGDIVGPETLTATQAAQYLGISPRHLWTLTKAKRIPHCRLGRRVLYRQQELQDWLSRQLHRSTDRRRA